MNIRLLSMALVATALAGCSQKTQECPPLKERFSGKFYIGAAINEADSDLKFEKVHHLTL